MKAALAIFGLLCCLGSLVAAASEGDHDAAKRLRDAGNIVPLEMILEDARGRHGGRVIEIELEREHGVYVYEVEFVDEQGAVHEYYYDAGDGRFLREKQGETEH